MKNTILVIVVICIFSYSTTGQTSKKIFTPKIGDTLPEYTFTDLRNYPKETASLSEFRGKWLIIDFWSKDCSGCLKSFPKMNDLQEQFKDNVKLLMVGNVNDIHFSNRVIPREKPTKQLYDRLEKLYNLKFTVAFDSVLAQSYAVRYLPFIIIVDPQGVVRYITSWVNAPAISAILKGDIPSIQRAFTGPELDSIERAKEMRQSTAFKVEDGSFLNDKQMIRSQLSLYYTELGQVSPKIDLADVNYATTLRAMNEGVLEAYRFEIYTLFRVAYFGVSSWSSSQENYYFDFSKAFIFETPDSVKFNHKENIKYAYQLEIPPSETNPQLIKKIMQKDLEAYFGLKGRVEKHLMPAYYLRVKDRNKVSKLMTQGKKNRFKFDANLPKGYHLVYNDVPMQVLCNHIYAFTGQQYPVIDNTGVDWNIDLDLRGYFLYDFNEFKKALADQGLILELGSKEMNTIVISDSDTYK